MLVLVDWLALSSAIVLSPGFGHQQKVAGLGRSPHVVAAEKIGTVDREELSKPYNCIVLGGGPAGVEGALRAAYYGQRVLLVDKPKAAPAGGGLDWGFGAPTGLFSKALRDTAKTLDIETLRAQGMDDDVIWMQIQNMCIRLAQNNARSRVDSLETFKVDYVQGEAQLLAPRLEDGEVKHQLKIATHCASAEGPIVVDTDNVLVCAGSTPLRLPGIPFDQFPDRVFDSDSINGLSFLPRSVVVVGAGIIAIEYAKILRKLGAEVTMLVRGSVTSALERIGIDKTIAERLIAALRKDDVTLLENVQVREFVAGENAWPGEPLTIALESSKDKKEYGTIKADIFLTATGRTPRGRGPGFGLEENGITFTDRGHIQVSPTGQSSVTGVYAAGDCTPGAALASTAVDEAQRAVGAMFGQQKLLAAARYPIGVWTMPEVAYYGLTKAAAEESKWDAEEGVATYEQCLRGRVFAPDGMLKLVFDKRSGRILGVHIIGTDACELVHFGMNLVDQEVTIFEVIGTLFTAVTFNELFKEAALNGNSKLEFGIQWQELLQLLSAGIPNLQSLTDEDLRQRFDEIDTSGDGSLDEEEMLDLFRRMGGKDVQPSSVATMINLMDDDGNGTIEWDEFVKIFAVIKEYDGNQAAAQRGSVWQDVFAARTYTSKELKHLFSNMDADGNGRIDEEEMLAVIKALGKDVSPKQVTEFFRLYDEDGNGTIEWDEFEAVYEKIRASAEITPLDIAPPKTVSEPAAEAIETAPAAAAPAAVAAAELAPCTAGVTVSSWLNDLEGGRFLPMLDQFDMHFQTVDDLIEVRNELGAEAILGELGTVSMTARVKLKKAIDALDSNVIGAGSANELVGMVVPTAATTVSK